jgi:hypothetical protein
VSTILDLGALQRSITLDKDCVESNGQKLKVAYDLAHVYLRAVQTLSRANQQMCDHASGKYTRHGAIEDSSGCTTCGASW